MHGRWVEYFRLFRCFTCLHPYARPGAQPGFSEGGGGTLKITKNSPQTSPEKLFITISATRFRAP